MHNIYSIVFVQYNIVTIQWEREKREKFNKSKNLVLVKTLEKIVSIYKILFIYKHKTRKYAKT